METLIPLEILFDINSLLAISLISLSVLIVILVVKSLIVDGKYRKHQEYAPDLDKIIFDFLESGDYLLLNSVEYNNQIRDHIVKLGTILSSNDRKKLCLCYKYLGFAEKDIRALRYGSIAKKSRAISRCRSLNIDLPDEAFRYLCKIKGIYFQWAIHEYLIALKGSAALPWIIAFSQNLAGSNKSIVLHLLSCLALREPRTLKVILEHNDNAALTEQLLRTLQHYPDPSATESILAKVKPSSPNEMIIAAVGSVASCPNEDVLCFYNEIIQHENWVIRLQVAKGLAGHNYDDIEEMVSVLVSDPSYHVRRASVRSLIALKPGSKKLLDEIGSNPEHPCNLILNEIKQIEQSRAS